MNGKLRKLGGLLTTVRDIAAVGIDYLQLNSAKEKITAGGMMRLLVSAGMSIRHPFILARSEDFIRVKNEYESENCNEITRRSLDFVFSYCDGLLNISENPVSEYVLEEDDGLLEVSRTVLQRISALCGAFRVSGEKKYAERAARELEAVCAFPDWHSEHFLDCAEMAFAVSLGCDWLWDYISEDRKKLFCDKTWEYAILPALSANKLKNWWTWSKTNWNNVCYSAIGAACMMFYSRAPEKAAGLLADAARYMPVHFSSFTPDGVYAEGSGYWEYGTAYLVYFIKNTRAFFGTDFGLSECKGFEKTGYFPQYITLPAGVFNYGDNKDIACASPVLYFFAEEYNSALPAAFENKYYPCDLEDSARDSMLTALWYSPGLLEKKSTELPLSVRLASDLSQELVIMRSSYGEINAVCAAIKAGANSINHGDLDIGTFVLDCGGVRWACELGQGNYAAPGYFMNIPGGGRWKNYCKRTEGQNTLVFVPCGEKAGEGQYAFAKCRFSSFVPYPAGGGKAVLDMTDAYRFSEVRRVVRTFELTEDFSRLIITDEAECDSLCDIYWFMHTRADITIGESGKKAVLSKDGKSIDLSLEGGSGAGFSVMQPLGINGGKYKYDRELPKVQRLCIKLEASRSVKLTVIFTLV